MKGSHVGPATSELRQPIVADRGRALSLGDLTSSLRICSDTSADDPNPDRNGPPGLSRATDIGHALCSPMHRNLDRGLDRESAAMAIRVPRHPA